MFRTKSSSISPFIDVISPFFSHASVGRRQSALFPILVALCLCLLTTKSALSAPMLSSEDEQEKGDSLFVDRNKKQPSNTFVLYRRGGINLEKLKPFGGSLVSGRSGFRPGFASKHGAGSWLSEPSFMFKVCLSICQISINSKEQENIWKFSLTVFPKQSF